MIYTLDHVHIFTSDPEATAEWFGKHFAANVIRSLQSDGKPRIDVQVAGMFIYLSTPAATTDSAAKTVPSPLGFNHLGLATRDVDQAFAELQASGVTVLQPPITARPGVRNAFIEGPDGIRIEIFWRDAIDYRPLRQD
jgi:catechol 2,3-dioxygenase-like lactoylglutathione lyase family enzyme